MAKLKGGMALDFSLEKSRIKEEVREFVIRSCSLHVLPFWFGSVLLRFICVPFVKNG